MNTIPNFDKRLFARLWDDEADFYSDECEAIIGWAFPEGDHSAFYWMRGAVMVTCEPVTASGVQGATEPHIHDGGREGATYCTNVTPDSTNENGYER